MTATAVSTRKRRHSRTPIVDPRVIGGTYYCSYWNYNYLVLDIKVIGPQSWYREYTVQVLDGTNRINTHRTAWDRNDCVVNH